MLALLLPYTGADGLSLPLLSRTQRSLREMKRTYALIHSLHRAFFFLDKLKMHLIVYILTKDYPK